MIELSPDDSADSHRFAMTALRQTGLAARVLEQFDKRGLATSLFRAAALGDRLAIEVACAGLDPATAEHIAETCRTFVGMETVELFSNFAAARAA